MVSKGPLTRASRIMLPTYPAVSMIFGMVWFFDPGQRLTLAPALSYARGLFPIWVWGAMWMILATVMYVALWARTQKSTRTLYMVALVINGMTWAAWGVVVEVAVFTEPNVSIAAGVLPFFVAVCCWASIQSLLWNEEDRG
jgi:hypothetical protein